MKTGALLLWLFSAILGVAILFIQGRNEGPAQSVSAVDRKAFGKKEAVSPATGPLKVHPSNPRYFTDGSGKAIYLTGSHHWGSLQDAGKIGQPLRVFRYAQYVEFLASHNHNYMRMWACEGGGNGDYCDPLPYARTGPGTALDGKPKFNLNRFNQAYFDRLRSRIIAARDRGIYVGIMLFNGWNLYDHGYGNPWPLHPFNQANNMNEINGDPDGDGEGREGHALQVPVITARQQAYVRKVVDTINDLDNVLYEITNETAYYSKEWQYHMIRFIHTYEATKPKWHPVGMTSFDASWKDCERERLLEALLSSPADWISPCGEVKANYATNPPAASGKKVVLSDTDHILGIGGDHNWVWKSFTRGLNPIYMDPIDSLTGEQQDPPGAETARMAMGDTRAYANRMNLAAMIPRSDLCSTTFCLANPGFEYLVYVPFGSHWLEPYIQLLPSHRLRSWIKSLGLFSRTVTVDLGATSRALTVEWFNPITGEITAARTRTDAGHQDFTAPFRGDAVLYLTAS